MSSAQTPIRLMGAAAIPATALWLAATAAPEPRERAFAAQEDSSPALTSTPARLDIYSLVQEAQRVQQADAAAWRGFRFSRAVRLERLGTGGKTLGVEESLSRVTPIGEGFDERLLRIDGREPTEKEIAAHREKEPFARHYRTLRAGGEDKEEEGGYSLATLLRLSSYEYAGREIVDGIECHRLDFSPDPDRPADGLEARVAGAMAGRLWLTVNGLHLIRARAASLRPVPLTLGLFSVRSLELELEAAEIVRDIWLPRRLTVVSNVRLIFMGQIRRRVITYSEFAPVADRRAGS